jgi:hypothetical protein
MNATALADCLSDAIVDEHDCGYGDSCVVMDMLDDHGIDLRNVARRVIVNMGLGE